MVSLEADETTDESVVGKFPTAAPFAFTPGLCAADGALLVVDETTDESSVANFAGAALADGDGEGDVAVTGDGSELGGVLPFVFCSFTCRCSSFTVSVSALTCSRSSLISGDNAGVEAASCARALASATLATPIQINFFIKTPDHKSLGETARISCVRAR